MNEEDKQTIKYIKSRLYGNEGCDYIDVAQEDLKSFVPGIVIENIEKDFIPIQKVKDKIEELDIAISECIYLDDDDEEYKKAVEKDKLCLLNQKSFTRTIRRK